MFCGNYFCETLCVRRQPSESPQNTYRIKVSMINYLNKVDLKIRGISMYTFL